MQLPNNQWGKILQSEYNEPYFEQLSQFIELEYEKHIIYPTNNQIFYALQLTDYDQTKVVILGQDPYHGEGQAEGLAFSVSNDMPLPPSLRNIMKERTSDIGIADSGRGSLVEWAKQGILLLNTVLTVRAGEANSHQQMGWELFTDAIISKLSNKEEPIIFVLWGKPAQQKKQLIAPHHIIIESVHPSPLAAYRGFWGSRPFSKINEHLSLLGHQPIDWNN